MTINLEDYDFKESKKEFNKFRLEYPMQMSNETLAEISLALDIADQVVKDASDEMIKAGWSAYSQFAKPENKAALRRESCRGLLANALGFQ